MVLNCLLFGCSSKEVEQSVQEKIVEDVKEEVVQEVEEEKIAYPSTAGQLSVDGAHLVDEKGNQIQLKGISTHGIAWFPQYINNDAFKQFRNEWNVNAIRLAMYTDENGGYCTDGNKEELKQLIKDGVKYATDNDMYVIVDWHILFDQNPNKYKEESIKFFNEMTTELKDHTNVIYEICNEPNGNTDWKDIKEYANEVIPVIRKNSPNAVVIVGTPTWSQSIDQAALDPLEFDNVMYALHFYAATHKEDLRNRMKTAIENNFPVFVSEYGICDASGNGSIDEKQTKYWIDAMNEYNVSYIAWNLSNKNETSAIIKPDCTKVNNFTSDDLSKSGLWLVSMLTNTEVEPMNITNRKESNGIKYEFFERNSWVNDGIEYVQYSLVLSSDEDVSSWSIEVPFENEFELSDSWNGNYEVKGKTLIISNKEYNGDISKDHDVSDVGFIVTSRIVEK